METIAPNTTRIDVEFQGKPNYIAACLLEGEGGPALIDPGPSSSLGQLRSKLAARGLSVADLGALLLTHIHLDHAGATGTLVRENPRLRVFVHQRGAPHLIDPTRLLESAARLYGADMERLWGEVLGAMVSTRSTPRRSSPNVHRNGRTTTPAFTPPRWSWAR